MAIMPCGHVSGATAEAEGAAGATDAGETEEEALAVAPAGALADIA
jgi:hypothetical protein